ncbi:clavata3-like [Striga asiatica]|uniref:Clavata3-like n=1 Tax=Striga asiatica TaxID=4170 RepID=A0A5A7P2Q1_STRAF|nr:clavata3-like [Striga asiatica]
MMRYRSRPGDTNQSPCEIHSSSFSRSGGKNSTVEFWLSKCPGRDVALCYCECTTQWSYRMWHATLKCYETRVRPDERKEGTHINSTPASEVSEQRIRAKFNSFFLKHFKTTYAYLEKNKNPKKMHAVIRRTVPTGPNPLHH